MHLDLSSLSLLFPGQTRKRRALEIIYIYFVDAVVVKTGLDILYGHCDMIWAGPVDAGSRS